MNIKITTKQTSEHEIEITLPFFRKQVTSASIFEYIAMLSEGWVHKAFSSDSSQSVTVRPLSTEKEDVIRAYNEDCKWEPISEEEFLTAYNDIISSLSLKPTLVYAVSADDLKDIKFS